MGFFFTRFFWGGLLICWGLVLILEKLLRVNIPFGRFIIAFILIYTGVYLITKFNFTKKVSDKVQVCTVESVSKGKSGREYSNVFGSNVVDFSQLTDSSEGLDINTVFGKTEIILSRKMTYEITANTVFGETVLPDQSNMPMGDSSVVLGDSDQVTKIPIEINTVFGSTIIRWKTPIESSNSE